MDKIGQIFSVTLMLLMVAIIFHASVTVSVTVHETEECIETNKSVKINNKYYEVLDCNKTKPSE